MASTFQHLRTPAELLPVLCASPLQRVSAAVKGVGPLQHAMLTQGLTRKQRQPVCRFPKSVTRHGACFGELRGFRLRG